MSKEERRIMLSFILSLALFSIILLNNFFIRFFSTYKLINISIFVNLIKILKSSILFIWVFLIIRIFIKYKLYKGIKQGLLALIVKSKIEKSFIMNDIYISKNLKKIPNIDVMFSSNKAEEGKITIETSLFLDEKLGDMDLNSILTHFQIINAYKNLNKNSYVYIIQNKKLLKKKVFKTLKEYIDWALENTDNNQIKLSDNIILNLHHMAISAQTGGGKTSLLQSLMCQLLMKEIKPEFYIIDPKETDLYNFGIKYIGRENVNSGENLVEFLTKVNDSFNKRTKELNKFFYNNPNTDYKSKNLPSIILIIDEYASLMNSLNKKEKESCEKLIQNFILKGRQLGFFVWIVTQQFHSDTLKTAIKEQLVIKIVLGASENQTYKNLFSQSVNIPKMNINTGDGFLSAPNIAKNDNPIFFVSAYCQFLEDSNLASLEPKAEKKQELP